MNKVKAVLQTSFYSYHLVIKLFTFTNVVLSITIKYINNFNYLFMKYSISINSGSKKNIKYTI